MSLHCTRGCGNHPSEVHTSCMSPSCSSSMVISGEEPRPGDRDQVTKPRVCTNGYMVFTERFRGLGRTAKLTEKMILHLGMRLAGIISYVCLFLFIYFCISKIIVGQIKGYNKVQIQSFFFYTREQNNFDHGMDPMARK